MNNESILYGIVGLITGALLTWFAVGTESSTTDKNVADSSQMTMSQMQGQLEGKVGDDFDKTFLAMMSAHHQGAIDMGEKAKATAKHEEIRMMAEEMIAAQRKEIEQMRQWQKQWGY